MDQQPDRQEKRRYVWPWFVFGAFLLAIVLSVIWMSFAVRRVRLIRDLNPPAPVELPQTNGSPPNPSP